MGLHISGLVGAQTGLEMERTDNRTYKGLKELEQQGKKHSTERQTDDEATRTRAEPGTAPPEGQGKSQ